jgi:O-acetylhomoserine/O-acetylserine sulfhydrylase-like pyridoxal-dependent enzyme
MKMDGNGRKNLISTSVSILVSGNGIGFGNGMICGCTKTNQYDRKFNGNGRKPEYHTSLYSQSQSHISFAMKNRQSINLEIQTQMKIV